VAWSERRSAPSDEDLKVGHVGAPPRSVAVWRQVSRDCLALLARPDYMACNDITPAGSLPHPRCTGVLAGQAIA
jgi:hypothetical protein